MPPPINAALRQEAVDANRLHHGTLSARQRHRLSLTIDILPRPCFEPTPWVNAALEQFGGLPEDVTWAEGARWTQFFAQLRTGSAGSVEQSVVLDGIGWDFVPSFVVHAPAHGQSEMLPMVAFVYIRAPAPDTGLDTATAGHLLALGLEQYRLDPGRKLYMPRVIAKYEAENRALVVDATISSDYLQHVAERKEVLDAFGPYLPGSFHVRSSGWLDCAVEEGRRCVFAALVFPFDLL